MDEELVVKRIRIIYETVGADKTADQAVEVSKAIEKTGKSEQNVSKLGDVFGKLNANVSKASFLSDKLFKSIGRIAFYRAIRSAIRKLTSGISEGMKNLYEWSSRMGTSFATNMDAMATSSLYLKNTLATALVPILEGYIIPMFIKAADAVAAFVDKIAAFIAALGGSSMYTSAKKFGTKWEESIGGASKALKDFTYGFDELNVFNNDTGGSGVGGANFNDMFEEVEIPSKIKDVADKVREILEPVFKFVKDNFDEILAFGLSLLGVFVLLGGNAGILGVVAGVGLLISGFSDLINAYVEFKEKGEITNGVISDSVWGILKIGGALALLTGSWIPLAVGAVASGLVGIGLEIAKNWDDIKLTFEIIWSYIKQFGAGIANIFVDAINGILTAWNIFIMRLQHGVNHVIDWLNDKLGTDLENATFGEEKQVELLKRIEVTGLLKVISPKRSAKVAKNELSSTAGGGVYDKMDMNAFMASFDPGRFASGGSPATGTLFWAGEKGPEVVSSLNGQSTVMNEDQFTQGIVEANEGVISAIYSMATGVINAIDSKRLSVKIGDKEIGQANDRYTLNRGMANTSGLFANTI